MIRDTMALIDQEAAELRASIDAGTYRWGRWRYDTVGTPALCIEAARDYEYDIPAARMTNARDLAGWMLHLREKRWVTANDLGNVVYAVHDLARLGLLEFRR